MNLVIIASLASKSQHFKLSLLISLHKMAEKRAYETQMPIAAEHAFKEKSAKLLILLPLRTI